MLRIAICDDLPEQLAKIKAATKQYFETYPEEQMEIITYNNPFFFIEDLNKSTGYDIILLDICMPGIDGIKVAAEIRRRKERSEIIFLTTSDEFAVDAFALKAVHYLVKPFTQAQFNEALDRAMERFDTKQVPKIVLKLTGSGIRALELNEILWIESCNHTQNIFLTGGGVEKVRESLSHLFAQLEDLSPGQFVSPCRGYLVNQKAIRTVVPQKVIMRSGQEIPLARGTFRTFSDRYFSYMFPQGDKA